MVTIVTRPEPGLSRTIARLAEIGRVGIALPLTRLVDRPLPPAFMGQVLSPNALVVTSANGADRTLDETLGRGLAAWCVGEQAAGRLRDAGYDLRATEQDSSGLLARLRRDLPARSTILYPCGVQRRRLLENELARDGHTIHPVELYDNAPVTWSLDAVFERLAGAVPDTVLLYAASAARAWSALMENGPIQDRLGQARPICLSADVAAVLPPSFAARAEIARLPDEESLFALLGKAV